MSRVLEDVRAEEACLSDLDTVHYPRTCLHPSTFENRSAGVIGDHCGASKSSAIGPDSVTPPPSGPPMGDASQWTPFIVGPMTSVSPLKALEGLHRGITDTNADWWTINLVRKEALAILPHSLGKAFLVVHKVASAAHHESVVALALRPVESIFAEALGQIAHRQACCSRTTRSLGRQRRLAAVSSRPRLTRLLREKVSNDRVERSQRCPRL
jgi:hypothetical protein